MIFLKIETVVQTDNDSSTHSVQVGQKRSSTDDDISKKSPSAKVSSLIFALCKI